MTSEEEEAVRTYHVYILASGRNGTFYVGVTSDLARRVWEHKHGLVEGFTKRYGVCRLVYCEAHTDIHEALRREKAIKRWRRPVKMEAIEKQNPQWDDLCSSLNQ